ncbi:hypothetical protein IMSAGC019_03513 [Lachnospiraceae bacterium]|nr:hypothetical protein IMSAGC019_03513 [Lachnospiraceae bacterium]
MATITASAFITFPFLSLTPQTWGWPLALPPFSIRIWETLLFKDTFTWFLAICPFKAAITSEEWSESGKILSPRSFFSAHPAFSKNSFTPWLSILLKALYRNFSLLTRLWKNSSLLQPLVRLHLPFPVIKSFFPVFSFCSRSVVSAPRADALMAAIMPAGPPPIIVTCFINPFLPSSSADNAAWVLPL